MENRIRTDKYHWPVWSWIPSQTHNKRITNITVTSQWARWRRKSLTWRLFTQPFIQARIKENIKARVTGLFAGNSPTTGEFHSQMASNAENVSIWWCHQDSSDLAWEASHYWLKSMPQAFIRESWDKITTIRFQKPSLWSKIKWLDLACDYHYIFFGDVL